MKKRGFPISAVIIMVLAFALLAIVLLRVVVRNTGVEFFDILIYLPTLVFLGENVADFVFSHIYIAFSAIILTGLILSTVSLCLRAFASDKVYCVSKMICDVLVTLYMAPWAFIAAFFMAAGILEYAWQWCYSNGDTPLLMLLFLVPVFFVFFSKVKFRMNTTVGNTALFVIFCGIVRIFALLIGDLQPAGTIQITAYSMSFITLWLFEQIQRDKDGKLNLLSRILLTGIAATSVIPICVTIVSFIYVMMITYGFSWECLNSLLLAIPVLGLFVCYIVKVNRIKK
ncbi:MAG: hypothetical protein IJN48_02775 [Clostridia bacterium]|nr:hypothetical protein [Clostridia bacterium]